MADPSKFSRFTPGLTPPQVTALAPQDMPQVATITAVSAAGAMFELALTPGHAYGPAPWGIGGYATVAAAITAGYKPHVGDRALIVFAGAGFGTPWIVAWYR